MWDGGVTSELFERLVSQGDIKPAVAAVGLGMKGAGGCDKRADRQVMADARGGDLAPAYELREGAGHSPIRLIVNNTAVRKSAMNRTPFLTIVRN